MRLLGVLLLAVATSAFPFQGWINNHVIGGSNVKGTDRLYQVSLVKKGGDHFCGGAALSDNYVVTAAHCLQGQDPKKISIRVGSLKRNEGKVHEIDPGSVTIMNCYNPRTHDCDIAVLKVKEKFAKSVIRVKLVSSEPPDDILLTVTGWGLTSGNSNQLPSDLQVASVRKVQRSRCNAQYNGVNQITDNMICAGDQLKNICQGDSGGPLVDGSNKLAGIVAWGAQDENHSKCSPEYPGVFTNIASPKVRSFLNTYVR